MINKLLFTENVISNLAIFHRQLRWFDGYCFINKFDFSLSSKEKEIFCFTTEFYSDNLLFIIDKKGYYTCHVNDNDYEIIDMAKELKDMLNFLSVEEAVTLTSL